MEPITAGRLYNVRVNDGGLDMSGISLYCDFDWQGSEIQPIAESFASLHALQEGYVPDCSRMEVALTISYNPVPLMVTPEDWTFFDFAIFIVVPEKGVEETRHETNNQYPITVTPDEAVVLKRYLTQAIHEHMLQVSGGGGLMKIYQHNPFGNFPTYLFDTKLILTDDDRHHGMYNFEQTTFIQPCENPEFCLALGMPEGACNVANINIDLSSYKPSVWIDTYTNSKPGEVFLVHLSEIELFELTKQAIHLFACEAQDKQEQVSFYERLGAHMAPCFFYVPKSCIDISPTG